MKYESNILKRLIDTYGVIGNPRYLSEIIMEFIVRGKELYPQLFTYQSDWLAHIDEFGLTPEYTISYTGQHIYAPNAKEKPVKSAILKGNTLVNCVDTTVFSQKTSIVSRSDDGIITIPSKKGSYIYAYGKKSSLFKPSTNYTLFLEIMEFSLSDGGLEILNPDSTIFTNAYTAVSATGYKKILLTTKDDISDCDITLRLQTHPIANDGGVAKVRYMILEGDYTKVDIPYFEGMTSVKMPVLKATGKNLFDGKILDDNKRIISSGLITNDSSFGITDYIPIESEKFYISNISGGYSNFYDNNKVYISTFWSSAGSLAPNNAKYVRHSIEKTNIDTYMFEQGTQATSYEPYKSNILTVNEDVVLRGIDDVKDTLDCLTGELTKRIEEIVLDGSEKWIRWYGGDDRIGYKIDVGEKVITDGAILCDKFRTKTKDASYISEMNSCFLDDTHIAFLLAKKDFSTIDYFKEWLSQNPITVQYQTTTESIKTVDLTIHDKDHQKVERLTSFEGGTHFTTSSQDGSLLPTLTVDVVTDLEKTLMVCSLEGNTM